MFSIAILLSSIIVQESLQAQLKACNSHQAIYFLSALSMNKNKYQHVINQQALENFDRLTQEQTFLSEEVVVDKPQRDPRINKERDQRRQNKRDRWDD